MVFRVGHFDQHLDPAPKIPRTQVGRTDEVLGVAVVREAIDARMLEKTSNDRHHANVL